MRNVRAEEEGYKRWNLEILSMQAQSSVWCGELNLGVARVVPELCKDIDSS